MTHFYIIQIAFVLMNFIESQHDYYVIRLQNQSLIDFNQLRKKWKFWSATYYMVVICVVTIISFLLFSNFWFRLLGVVALLCNRAIFFELPLNVKLYGWGKLFYVDSSSKVNIEFAELLGGWAGKNLGLVKFCIATIAIVLANVIMTQFL